MRDLQAAYVAGLDEPMAALSAALESADTTDELAVRRVSHQLKGSGASFGYPEISRLAAEVLDAPTDGVTEPAQALLALLRETITDAQDNAATILVVDDDPAIRLLLEVTASAAFDSMRSAGTLAEARACLAEAVPSVLLLDLELPDGDGRALLEEIRSQPDLGDLRIALMSAHRDEETRDECLRLGADGYLQKPFEVGSISEQLADLLDQERRTPTAVDELEAQRAIQVPEATRVLLAEDDPMTAGLVLDRLIRSGFDVIHFEDGQAALEAARHRNFDAAVIDVNMPRMNGFELLARLRDMRRHAETPVLVLTALGDDASVVKAFDLGADDYVVKPFSPSELTARITRLVAA